MRKAFFLSAFLVLTAGLLGACNASVTPVAARVNGSAISVSTLNDVLNAIGGDAPYRCDITANNSSSSTPLTIFGAGNHTFSSSFVAQQLALLIGARALHQNVEALHLGQSTLPRQVALLVLGGELAPPQSSSCTTPGATVLADLAPSGRNVLISFFEDEAVLATHFLGANLTPVGITSYEKGHLAQTQLSCTEAILVPTAAKAAAVERQLHAGANFSAVAHANSTDTASAAQGGVLGCLSSAQLASPLNTIVENLPIGQTSAAIAYSGNYVILRVTARKAPPLAQAAEILVVGEQQATDFSNHLNTLIGSAHVDVSPAYGSWKKVSNTWAVVPTKGPARSVLANPLAVVPGGAAGG